jgi:hypothetical protein
MELIMGEHLRGGQRERMESGRHPDDDAGDLQERAHPAQWLGHRLQDQGDADPGRGDRPGPGQPQLGPYYLERLFHDDIQSAADAITDLDQSRFRVRILRYPSFRRHRESRVAQLSGNIVGGRLTQPLPEAFVSFGTVNYGRWIVKRTGLAGQNSYLAFDLYAELPFGPGKRLRRDQDEGELEPFGIELARHSSRNADGGRFGRDVVGSWL